MTSTVAALDDRCVEADGGRPGHGEGGHGQRDIEQPAGGLVGQHLGAALALLGLLHQPRCRPGRCRCPWPAPAAAVAIEVPAMTRSPGCLPTGLDSPVIMAALTSERPSTTSPSTGTLAPGRTNTRSPRRSD